MARQLPLGDKIRHARERLGLTQQELADLLRVDRGSVSNWERGRTRPGRYLLAALETILGSLDGEPDDLYTLAVDVRNSAELTARQKQVLLGLLAEPRPRHATSHLAVAAYPEGWLQPR
jgi:transcriptional regulator with XRE-family HTH domain